MTRAAVLGVFAVARHCVITATALSMLVSAHLAIFAGATIYGCLVVFAVFLAAGHLFAFAAGFRFGGVALLAMATSLGSLRCGGFLALFFVVLTTCTSGLFGSFLSGTLLRDSREPSDKTQDQSYNDHSQFHFVTSKDSLFDFVRGTSHADTMAVGIECLVERLRAEGLGERKCEFPVQGWPLPMVLGLERECWARKWGGK